MAPGTVQRLAAGLDASEYAGPSRFPHSHRLPRTARRRISPGGAGRLRDGSAEVRLKAIEFLSHAAPRDDRLLADLTPLLNDPEPRMQCKAIDAIRGLGPISREALPAVVAKLKSANPDVRLAAAELVKGTVRPPPWRSPH